MELAEPLMRQSKKETMMRFRSIQILGGSVCVMMLMSCAAFQSKPELKSVTAMDLFEWIDNKATVAEQESRGNRQAADRLRQIFAATKQELQRRVNNGEITDIEAFNRLGFGLVAKPDDSKLPSSEPDSTRSM